MNEENKMKWSLITYTFHISMGSDMFREFTDGVNGEERIIFHFYFIWRRGSMKAISKTFNKGIYIFFEKRVAKGHFQQTPLNGI